MSALIAMDIDNCCANGKERARRAGPEPDRLLEPKRYEVWKHTINAGIEDDEPVSGMREVCTAFASAPETRLVYITARGEELADATAAWLEKHRFPFAPIIFRRTNDLRKSADYKEEAITGMLGAFVCREAVVFDDDERGELEAICRKNGWTFKKAATCLKGR